jgi:Mannosyltransferase (PIG-V)
MALTASIRPGLGFADTFTRWDNAWYLDAATNGYAQVVPEVAGRAKYSNVPFFPLWPATMRGLSQVTGLSALRAGLLLGFLLGLTATLLLWALARRLRSEEAANRTVALFCFFPGSLVMSMVYAEPLMLTLVLICMFALLSQRWLGSGMVAALATACRPNAVALVPCCLWVAVRAVRERREWRAMISPLLAPVGMVGYFAFLWDRTGEPLAWFRVQNEAWHESFDFGLTTVQRLGRVLLDPFGNVNDLVAALGLVFLVAAGVVLVRSKRLPAVLNIYTVGILFLALGSSVLGARPRFVWTAFPLFIPLGERLKGTSLALVVGTFAALLVCLTVMSVATQALGLDIEAIP